MSYYNPRWMGYSAFIIAGVNAFAFPLFGFIFSKLMFILMGSGYTKTFAQDRDFWCGMFLIECIMIGLFSFLQKWVFSIVGENLTFDVRFDLFKGIIYKHLQWFDNKQRAPGILSNVLSEDIGALNGLTTENFSIVTEAFLGLIIGVIFALVYNWKMGLISLAFVPFVVLGSVLTSQLQWKQKGRAKASEENQGVDFYQASNALLSDILMNYRTVIGFGAKNVDYLLDKFDELLEEPNMLGIKNAHISGFYFGYG
jgi:ATP-binding cassette subfamily B (MDR/TAP) protein 1